MDGSLPVPWPRVPGWRGVWWSPGPGYWDGEGGEQGVGSPLASGTGMEGDFAGPQTLQARDGGGFGGPLTPGGGMELGGVVAGPTSGHHFAAVACTGREMAAAVEAVCPAGRLPEPGPAGEASPGPARSAGGAGPAVAGDGGGAEGGGWGPPRWLQAGGGAEPGRAAGADPGGSEERAVKPVGPEPRRG